MINYDVLLNWMIIEKNEKTNDEEAATINKILYNLINEFKLYEKLDGDEYNKNYIINLLMDKLNYLKYEINR